MGLGMSMGMSMRLIQDQRLELEQTLQEKLEQQLECKLTLKQYIEKEDEVQKLIRWVDEHKAWVNFNKEGFNFTYGALPYKLVKHIADKAGFGFAHCMYNPFEALFFGKKVALSKGDWTLFVVKDKIPEDLQELVAIHERGEEISLGDHYFASQLEFALTGKQRKVRRYVSFVDENYPNKFVDLTQRVNFPILPEELVEYLTQQGKRNEQELERTEELIEQHPIPTTALRKMSKYEGITQEVCELLRKNIAFAQRIVYSESSNAFTSPETLANLVDEVLVSTLRSIPEDKARVVSRARVNEELRYFDELVSKNVVRIARRNLDIPADFKSAYEDARKGERLVTVHYTVEDRARMKGEEFRGYSLAVNE